MDNKTLYVGCDVSTGDNYVCAMLSNKSKVFSKKYPNNLEGSGKLILDIEKAMADHKLDSILFGVESTSNYHFHILNFIGASILNQKFSLTLFQLNATLIHNYKKIFTKTSKTDKYDSYIIAHRLCFGDLPEPFETDNEYESLKRLTRTRFHIVKELEREYNYFLSQVYLKFSNYRDLPFSSTFGVTSISILTDFEIEELIQMPEDGLIDFLIRKSKDKFDNPEKIAEDIKKIARNCYRVNQRVADAINTILKVSIQTIKSLKDALKTINKAIEKELEHFNVTINSMPGIGPIFTACIIAEIGNRKFSNDGKLAKFAGLTWNKYQSGDFDADDTSLNKSGNKYLRYYLVQAANSVKNHCPEFAAFYSKKYKEATTHHHKRALVLTARKLLRTLFILLRDKTLYDPYRSVNTAGGDSCPKSRL